MNPGAAEIGDGVFSGCSTVGDGVGTDHHLAKQLVIDLQADPVLKIGRGTVVGGGLEAAVTGKPDRREPGGQRPVHQLLRQ